jgi:hypothetical protein
MRPGSQSRAAGPDPADWAALAKDLAGTLVTVALAALPERLDSSAI